VKRLLPMTLAVGLVVSFGLALLVGAQVVNGTVSGVVSSPSGPLGRVKVNIVDSAGTVAGTTVTSSSGAYSVGNLPAGMYTVQIVDDAGKVLGTGTGMVTAGAPAVTINVALTSGQLSGAAISAGSTGFRLSTTKVLAAAAAAGAGVYAVHALSDSSPNR
jgi:Carboxypeptidase regulatory-like domain